MPDISQNILDQIKQQDIHPKPRWEFLMKNYVFWSIFTIFVVLGGLAVSVIIFMLTDHDWDIYKYLDKSFTEYLFLSIPYFWFLIVAGILVIAWVDFRNTKQGYKYNFAKIGLLNIVASIILGTAFFYSGVGIKVEKAFSDNIPFYQNIHPMRNANLWENPERGMLIGEITEFTSGEEFNLRDINNQNWIIKCISCFWRNGMKGGQGMIVKILGKKIEDGIFQVSDIRPGKMDCGGPAHDINSNFCKFPAPPVPMPEGVR